MSTLIAVRGIARTSEWFRWKLVDIGTRLNIDPDFLATIISLESGFNAAAVNRYTGATGLIQFMPKTAKRLGTSVAALRSMSAESQLAYVEKFFRSSAGRLRNVGDAYMAVFLPVHIGKPADFVLAERGSSELVPGAPFTQAKLYEQNAGLDRDKDGILTVGDVTSTITSLYQGAIGLPRVSVPDEEPPRPKAQGS